MFFNDQIMIHIMGIGDWGLGIGLVVFGKLFNIKTLYVSS